MVERPQPPTSGSNGVAVSGGGRRRTLLWVALGTALLLLILAGLVTLAPTHAARWIVDRYFTGLPADVSGVTTLDVDLLRGEITFGPVTFHAGEAAPGRVGRLGLDLSVRKLFQRQVARPQFDPRRYRSADYSERRRRFRCQWRPAAVVAAV